MIKPSQEPSPLPSVWVGFAAALAGISAGCSRDGVLPVTCEVRYEDGEPVRQGVAVFESRDLGVRALAQLDRSGHCQPTIDGSRGLRPGVYTVALLGPPPESTQWNRKPVASDRYRRTSQSPLRIEVGEKLNFELEVERPEEQRLPSETVSLDDLDEQTAEESSTDPPENAPQTE